MGYAELLKDPRWQKKRLEIMERDEWTCQTCRDTKATLTVHHKSYRMEDGKLVEVWDYEDCDLITLCELCHSEEEAALTRHKKQIYFAMRAFCIDSEAILLAVRVFKEIVNKKGRRVNNEDISILMKAVSDMEVF